MTPLVTAAARGCVSRAAQRGPFDCLSLHSSSRLARVTSRRRGRFAASFDGATALLPLLPRSEEAWAPRVTTTVAREPLSA